MIYAGGPQQQGTQNIYVGQQAGGGPIQLVGTPVLMSAPTGRWKDGLFDCCSNLWPSCGCLLIFSGVWLVAQMSQKTNWIPFKNVVNPYFGLYIICFFISLFVGGAVMLIPTALMWILTIALRIHIAQHYNIRGGCFQEFLTGFFCPCFSVPQMARHVYGYTKIYDGDSDPLVSDYYGRLHREHQGVMVV